MRRLGPEWKNDTWMYQHMSCHYRKILNAKKSVDTSPPRCFKPRSYASSASTSPSPVRNRTKKSISRNVSPIHTVRTASVTSLRDSGCSRYSESSSSVSIPVQSEMDLVDRIIFDTKYGPLLYCHIQDIDVPPEVNQRKKAYTSPYKPRKTRKSASPKQKMKRRNFAGDTSRTKHSGLRPKVPADVMERDEGDFVSYEPFHPRILKTDAQSKVKELHVYHPPRRKRVVGRKDGWTEKNGRVLSDTNECRCKCKDICDNPEIDYNEICTCETQLKPQSQTSSRDSAYNGGVSSVPDSRSPTPDQKGSMEAFRKAKEERIISGVLQAPSSDFIVYRAPNNTPTEDVKRDFVDSQKKLRPATHIHDELLYLNLIQDITSEVLEKGLYTNKSLKNVMKKHIEANIKQLDMDRMIAEIDKLRIQLGIPKDDSENGLNFGLGPITRSATATEEETEEMLMSYRVISDSEFKVRDNMESDLTEPCDEKEQFEDWDSHHNLLDWKSGNNLRSRDEKRDTRKDSTSDKMRVKAYVSEGERIGRRTESSRVTFSRSRKSDMTRSRQLSKGDDLLFSDRDSDSSFGGHVLLVGTTENVLKKIATSDDVQMSVIHCADDSKSTLSSHSSSNKSSIHEAFPKEQERSSKGPRSSILVKRGSLKSNQQKSTIGERALWSFVAIEKTNSSFKEEAKHTTDDEENSNISQSESKSSSSSAQNRKHKVTPTDSRSSNDTSASSGSEDIFEDKIERNVMKSRHRGNKDSDLNKKEDSNNNTNNNERRGSKSSTGTNSLQSDSESSLTRFTTRVRESPKVLNVFRK